MKTLYLSMLTAVTSALFLCAPTAEAGRRDPDVPVVVTAPPGAITTHAETPTPSPLRVTASFSSRRPRVAVTIPPSPPTPNPKP